MNERQKLWLAFVAGLLFAIGLGVSGMTQPTKVLGFLDVTGDWDPSLAFVMGGAVLVHFVAHRFFAKREKPLYSDRFDFPKLTKVDGKLVAGAAIFGVGWGLAGYCPGPVLVSAAAGEKHAILFVVAMTAGMVAQHLVARAFAPPEEDASHDPS